MLGSEQLSLTRLIEVSVDDFELSLKYWKYSFLATHSNIDSHVMLKEVARKRSSKLFDERRKSTLTEDEYRKKDHFHAMADDANEYQKWIVDRELQPLIRDLFLSQCVGFENCIKTLAVASEFSRLHGLSSERLIFVPSKEFNDLHKRVNNVWGDKKHVSDRLEYFFQTYFPKHALLTNHYSGLLRFDFVKWLPIWHEIYRLRNAVAHSRARPSEQLEIGDEIFRPSEEAQLTEFTLGYVCAAFQELINCFRCSLDDL